MLTFEVLFDVVSFGRETWKPDPDDCRAHEPLTDEVDAFAEKSAHDREPDERSLVGFGKAIEKRAPLVLLHRGPLDKKLDLGCERLESFVNGCHVLVRREVQ